MPGWLQVAVGNNPVTHLTSAARGLAHGQVLWGDIGWVLGASFVITAVAAPIALRMYRAER
jgi:ABC-2 type transport system permease protein